MVNKTLRKDQKAALATALRVLWEQAHGTPAGKVQVLVGPIGIAVLIKDAFSPAEQAAAQRAEG